MRMLFPPGHFIPLSSTFSIASYCKPFSNGESEESWRNGCLKSPVTCQTLGECSGGWIFCPSFLFVKWPSDFSLLLPAPQTKQIPNSSHSCQLCSGPNIRACSLGQGEHEVCTQSTGTCWKNSPQVGACLSPKFISCLRQVRKINGLGVLALECHFPPWYLFLKGKGWQ